MNQSLEQAQPTMNPYQLPGPDSKWLEEFRARNAAQGGFTIPNYVRRCEPNSAPRRQNKEEPTIFETIGKLYRIVLGTILLLIGELLLWSFLPLWLAVICQLAIIGGFVLQHYWEPPSVEWLKSAGTQPKKKEEKERPIITGKPSIFPLGN